MTQRQVNGVPIGHRRCVIGLVRPSDPATMREVASTSDRSGRVEEWLRKGSAEPMPRAVTEQQEEQAPRPLAMHLAARLRELRARRGFTQDHVAKRLGCHESAVSRWESGSRFPTGEDLVALADLFEVSTDDLLGRGKQFANAGAALVDMRLLERLAGADATADFDKLIAESEEQAVWLPVPEGAVLIPVAEAMRLTRKVADKHRDSKFVDRLFRPRV
jgi:transcriptional regulator with XRE-family HTH domain